jgi:iron complex outermembrane receptor protein
MNPVLLRHAARVLLLLALALVPAAFAQTAGTIQGRIFNPTSGEYVRNAEVRLDGTNRVTYSEGDGTFVLRQRPRRAGLGHRHLHRLQLR